MSRTRLIRPEMAMDGDLAVLDPSVRLLDAFLPCLADRAGVLEDQARTIQFKVFPGQPGVDIEGMLDQLANIGRVTRYIGRRLDDADAAPVRLLHLPQFARTQKPHRSEVPTCFTLPNAQRPSCESGVDNQGHPSGLPRTSARTTQDMVTAAHSDSCSDARTDTEGDARAGARDPQESPPVVTDADHDGITYHVTGDTRAYAADLLAPHGLTVKQWMTGHGLGDHFKPAHMTQLKAEFKGKAIDPQAGAKAETERRNQAFREIEAKLVEQFGKNPNLDLEEWIRQNPGAEKFSSRLHGVVLEKRQELAGHA